MHDLAFYNAGCHGLSGPRRVIVPFRRLLRRLLRPVFFRQLELYQDLYRRLEHQDHAIRALQAELEHLARRQEHTNDQMQATLAFGWDHVAVVRRLGMLEDEVDALRRGHPAVGEGPAQQGMTRTESRARVA